MFIEAQLIFKYYNPKKLEPGMLFINNLYPGNEEKQHSQVWKITEDYFNKHISDDKIIEENGFPIKPFIAVENLIITPDEIGTFVIINEGEDEEEYIDFGVAEMNFSLREFDGLLEILIDEDTIDNEIIEPIYDEDNDNKVIIKFIDDDE